MGTKSNGKRFGIIMVVLAAIFLMSQLSYGVQMKRKYHGNRNKPISMQNAFTISFDNDVTNDAFSGITISGLHHYSNNSAVKVNLGIGHALRDYHIDDNYIYNDNDGDFLNNYDETDRYEIRLSAQHIGYPSYNNRFNFYYGVGPILTLHYTAIDYTDLYQDNYGHWYEDESRETYQSISIGGIGTLGMEMFVAPNLSIVAEYELTLQHEWSEYKYEETYLDEPLFEYSKIHDEHNFSTSQIKLGMSLHF